MPGLVPIQVGNAPNLQQPQQEQVNTIAAKHGLPFWLLWGVYGVETSFGKDIHTSSTGALGAFQFEPATIIEQERKHPGSHYPTTNTPNAAEFAQQADFAAQYLQDLIAEHGGNVNAALLAYSGGGYGQTDVKKKGGQNVGGAVGKVVPSPGDVAGAAAAPFKAAESFFKLLTDPQTWIRLGEAVAGMVLIYLGLKTLTGADPAGAAARAAGKVV